MQVGSLAHFKIPLHHLTNLQWNTLAPLDLIGVDPTGIFFWFKNTSKRGLRVNSTDNSDKGDSLKIFTLYTKWIIYFTYVL